MVLVYVANSLLEIAAKKHNKMSSISTARHKIVHTAQNFCAFLVIMYIDTEL